MMLRKLGIALLLLTGTALAASPQGAVPPPDAGLVVHEWGTFLAMQGEDGVTLDGMYHEEHALPGFVHARSRDQLRLPLAVVKGETPVIYFYTSRPQKVRVMVTFPRGLWTQWYPQVAMAAPGLADSASPPALRRGRLIWSADVIPAGGAAPPTLPAAAPGGLWRHAREVDAAYVRTRDETRKSPQYEHERFLFYRGLGSLPLPLTITAAQDGTLTWSRGETEPARQLFVLRVEGGRGSFRVVPQLAPGASLDGVLPDMADARPLPEFTRAVADALAVRLVEAGLYPREARAMVNTWKESYFHTDGVRVLFLLPQTWTERELPLRLYPQPRELVRVMVGRLELLTPQRERAVELAVADLGHTDSAARGRAFETLRAQGRYAEPVLRRVLRATTDERVRALASRLLLTPFVTELRAAVRDAATGGRLHEDPVHVRAQLACLLREIGLDQEAKEEAQPVLTELRARREPPPAESESRHHLRAFARAMEAAGDTPGAVERYGRFLRFAAQSLTRRECTGCHRTLNTEGPRDAAWFRDWWAGRRYARLALRGGSRQPPAGEDPGTATLMRAYLLEARGERRAAELAWQSLGAGRQGLSSASSTRIPRPAAVR